MTKRQPRGIPVGGQFAAGARAESDVAVHPAADQKRYITNPNAKSASEWWDKASALTDQSGLVPTMGRDDGTPRRRTYRGDDYSVTMPSHASAMRFAKLVGDSTGDPSRPFEMPIEYTDAHGKSTMTAVRVSRVGRGFDVRLPADFPADRRAKVSESVRATLESRTPSVSPGRTRDLMRKYRERSRAEGVRTSGVLGSEGKQSWIKELGYDRGARTLTMVTQKGSKNNPTGAYQYTIDESTWNRVSQRMSEVGAGKAYNEIVRPNHKSYDQATRCDQCGRWYGSQVQHVCAAAPASI